MACDLNALLAVAELPADAIELGRIADAWGVHGAFKLLAHSGHAQALLAAKHWYAQASERGAKTFSGTLLLPIREAREQGGALVARAQGLDERETAEALRGARVFAPRSGFPPTAQDEYYWVDLLGLEVVNRQGLALGRVRQLLPTGPQTVLVLACEQDGQAQERMIPFVSAFIDRVELAEKRITVDWQPDY